MRIGRLLAVVSRPLTGLSLRTRLVAGFAIPMAGLSLFILVYLPARFENGALGSLRAEASAIASMAAFSVSPALYFGDRDGLDEAVTAALRNPKVSYLDIRDTTGTLVQHWHGPAPTDEQRRVEATETIPFQAGPGGTLTVGLSATAVRAEVRRSRVQGALFSGTIFLFGLGGIVVMSGIIVRPVHRMASTARRIADGDLSLRVGHRSADELGTLTSAFDAMVAHLVTAQDALQAANRDLEARVDMRTAELRAEIRERARAEEDLRASESRLRAVFESAALGMVLLDAEGRIVDGNPALVHMVGQPRAAWVGRRFAEFVAPESVAAAAVLLPPVALHATSLDPAELSVQRSDGTRIFVRAAASVVPTGAGELPGVILVLVDVTRERDLEARVRESQKLEAIGRLAGGVAHDFNNLLTTINGIAELLIAEAPRGSRAAADLRDLRHAGDRAAHLTRQLLAFGRRQILRRRPVDMNAVARDTLAGLELGDHILVRTELAPALPTVLADPGLMQEVLVNLVRNAVDAMPGGGRLTIRTHLETVTPQAAAEVGLDAPGPHVVVEVEDTGTGMDARTLTRIFEPFFSTKQVEARQVGRGAGLGLASVYGILRQSGGAVAARSDVGRGSLFRVLLPPNAQDDGAGRRDVRERDGTETPAEALPA